MEGSSWAAYTYWVGHGDEGSILGGLGMVDMEKGLAVHVQQQSVEGMAGQGALEPLEWVNVSVGSAVFPPHQILMMVHLF